MTASKRVSLTVRDWMRAHPIAVGPRDSIERARAHGVRLVLPLGNFWDAYGGARQYVAWAGLPAPVEGDPRFFSDRRVVEHYRAHVAALLSRTSTVDGIRSVAQPAERLDDGACSAVSTRLLAVTRSCWCGRCRSKTVTWVPQ